MTQLILQCYLISQLLQTYVSFLNNIDLKLVFLIFTIEHRMACRPIGQSHGFLAWLSFPTDNEIR